jgi:hypothetical protein
VTISPFSNPRSNFPSRTARGTAYPPASQVKIGRERKHQFDLEQNPNSDIRHVLNDVALPQVKDDI